MTEVAPTIDGVKRRRVALVAYFYPPLGGVAVARTLGFVRHLPAAGWEPVVIAPAGSPYPLRDEAAGVGQGRVVDVHRALSPEPGHLARLARRLIGLAQNPTSGSQGSASASNGGSAGASSAAASAVSSASSAASSASAVSTRSATSSGSSASSGPSLGGWPGRVRRLIWFPDDQLGWLPFAVGALVTAHRQQPLAAVVSSASPVTAHVAAWIGARLIGVPWVADFRDPWLDNPLEPMTGFARWRRATLEHAIVRSAARCTFATRGLRDAYAARYPRLSARFDVLPNGYERPSSSGHEAVRAAERDDAAGDGAERLVHLVYAGSLYRPPELDTFLEGVARLADDRPDAARRLEITFIGAATAESRAVADRWLADPRVAPIVRLRGFVPRDEAVAAIAQADAALTLLGGGPGMEVFVGAKLYDYIALDRQVLAMVPQGDARDVLAELGWGIIADPEPRSVASALARLVDEPPLCRRADPEGRYDRAKIAARLGALLDELVPGAP